MTAVVRCFARGQVKVAAQDVSTLSGKTILIMSEPYIARESLTASTSDAVTTAAALAANNAKLLQVQIQNGKSVHVRVSPNGDSTVVADASDPVYSGDNVFTWGNAHYISFLESA